ncbi:MAG TPA: helix-turn-helix transcriptional regulator [Pedococcus sp.]|jgi:transcriptional regulator with XRE-family HTH domain
MSRIPLGPLSGNTLGDYLREQRKSARLSLRQLSELAGVSNPYLSQIERGLKKPSAEILQQLAKGLEVSAESLYVRAGILDERHDHEVEVPDTRAVISADPRLGARQKAALLDIYDSFVAAGGSKGKPAATARRRTTTRKSPTTQGD